MKLKLGQSYVHKKTRKEVVIRRITDEHVFFGKDGRAQIENFMESYEMKKNLTKK